MEPLSFENFTKWVRECLSRSYGEYLNFEVIYDEIFASEAMHGQVLVNINFTGKTAFIGSADRPVQALGNLLGDMGYSLEQGHDGKPRIL